jgi:L-ascorbate metabolism protein UlaG (beta-lactamase superfamily)
MTAGAPGHFKATWMGVTTILFDDGETSVLIDGFFTRPGLTSMALWKVGSDEKIVSHCLQKAGIDNRLKAVLVAHSHYDHAMDAPLVCHKTGAKLVGSESTRLIAEGHGLLPLDQTVIIKDGDVLNFGNFRITVFESPHSPGDTSPGQISSPLQTPCRFKHFKSDKCYSFLFEYGEHRVFVHPSANFTDGKFQNVRCTDVFLGMGVLGKQTAEFRERYWEETVGMMQARRIIPVHWDNFWKQIGSPLEPLPWPFDKWSVTIAWLREKAAVTGVEIHIPKLWEGFYFD